MLVVCLAVVASAGSFWLRPAPASARADSSEIVFGSQHGGEDEIWVSRLAVVDADAGSLHRRAIDHRRRGL